jgi:hypothetical protein
MDESERRNEASPALLEQAKKNKVTVRTSIQTLRESLDQLESDFSSNPDLRRYYTRLLEWQRVRRQLNNKRRRTSLTAPEEPCWRSLTALRTCLLEMQR